jgi:protein-S-isoprenylcysteine O-methyltransferase Ste14
VSSVIKTMIFTLLVPGAVTVVIPYRLLGSGPRTVSHFGLIGASMIALGLAVYLWCAWDFATAGRGTPAPFDSPKILVARGLYRIVRNPMYVGVLLILFGESITFASFTIFKYAIVIRFFFHLFVVFYEEPTLKQKFGASYEEYRKTVPRWIPRARAASSTM